MPRWIATRASKRRHNPERVGREPRSRQARGGGTSGAREGPGGSTLPGEAVTELFACIVSVPLTACIALTTPQPIALLQAPGTLAGGQQLSGAELAAVCDLSWLSALFASPDAAWSACPPLSSAGDSSPGAL